MFPAYGWTDSPPHHRNQMVYIPSDSPRIDAIPPHVKMNPAALNLHHRPWPYGGSCCHPVPQECHGRCNHNCFGSPYSFQPPYPLYPPPPPMYHIHGGCSPYPGAYPAYSVPPPHYSMEQPLYEYDKNASWDYHCCGCPHHLSKREGDKNVNIQSEEREAGQKSDSLVPSELKNYRYPVLWIRPGYMKNIESEAKNEGMHPHDSGNNERLKPVNINYLEPSKRSGNDNGIQSQQAGDRDSLPFPVFWLPYKNNEVEKDTKENNSCQVTSNQPPSFASNDKKMQLKINEEISGSEPDSKTMDKHAVQKVIPVKQMEIREGSQKKANSETVENAGEVGEGKRSEDGGPKKPSSPKSPKLPPVCLRVDPLPRKKNGNGSSSSPSPPATKGKTEEPVTNNVRVSQQPSLEEKSFQQQMQSQGSLNKGKEVEQGKSNIKSIDVMDTAPLRHKQDLKQSKDMTSDSAESKLAEPSILDVEKTLYCEKEENSVGNEAERKKLSEEAAAVIIQSAYHGFEVRKSQPLKKLREIAEVKKQIVEINGRIRDMESSPDIHDKEKVVIGETIMSLLLKLDTIQGLHPRVRDIRKSVAKELVGLQEKLDALASRKSEALSKEASSVKPLDASNTDSEDAAIQVAVDQAQFQVNDSESVESGSSLADERHGPEAAEPSMPMLADAGILEKTENEAKEAQNDAGVLTCHLDLEPPEEMRNQQCEKIIDPAEPPTSEETKQFVDPPPLLIEDDNTASAEEVGKDDNVNQQLEEMPTGVPGLQEAPICRVDVDFNEVDQPRKVSVKEGEITAELEGNGGKVEDAEEDDKALEDAGVEQQEAVLVDPVAEPEAEDAKAVSHRKGETLQGDNGGEVGDLEKGEYALEEEGLQPPAVSVEPPESEAVHIQPVEVAHQLEVMSESQREIDSTHDEIFKLKDIHAPTEQRGSLDIEEPLESVEDGTSGGDCEETCGTKDVNVVGCELTKDETGVCQEPPKLNGEEKQGSPVDEPNNILVEEDAGIEREDSHQLSPTKNEAPTDADRKLVEENERLKEMMENLIKAGNEQLATICKLSGRVKDLEKKLSKKKKMRLRRCKIRTPNLQDELRACQV